MYYLGWLELFAPESYQTHRSVKVCSVKSTDTPEKNGDPQKEHVAVVKTTYSYITR